MAASVLQFPPYAECLRRFRVLQVSRRCRLLLDVIDSDPGVVDLEAIQVSEHRLLTTLPIETAKQIKMNGAASVLRFQRSKSL